MKCYYEVLDVSRGADDSEIKTSYRKLALKWHPDKNLENPEEAKENFQLLQQAYEVLSDPHERSWYDNHREQILRGKQSDYEDESLDLFQYFTVSCFKGYGDDPGGFYQVYSEVFKSLAKEDAEFMEDPEEIANYPSFGDSNSSYDDFVGPFYAFWQSYCTKKSYSWLCPYNIKEIKDRRILREIEKDMKKIVQKAKRERNEEVRNLVAFIRKRDKRVHAYKKVLEERAEINRQKQEQNRREQILRRKKEIEEQKSSQNHISAEDYEEHLRQMEQEYGSSDEDYDDDDYSEIGSQEDPELIEDGVQYIDELFCPACNKCFKNENAFLNHETSKKHRENLEKLKLEMLKDEENFGQVNGDESNTDCDNLDLDEDANQENGHDSENEEQEACKTPQKKSKGKKDKKSKRSQKETFDHADDEADVPDLLSNIALENGDDEWSDDKKTTRKQKTKKPEQKKSKASNQTKVEKVEASTANEEKPVVTEDSKIDLDHSCVSCKSKFPSKNKLFNHLKSTGHGVYIPKATKKPTASTSNTPAAQETHKKGKRNK